MRKFILSFIVISIIAAIVGGYFFNDFWIHRYDDLIAKQSAIYRLDKELVWSVIHEETYFKAWEIGSVGEVGLMQVTLLVAKDWAKESGIKDLENQINTDPENFLKNPEKNIQIGCWYLEKLREKYRDKESSEAMTLAAYNAGPSRVEEWTKTNKNPTEQEFIESINIASTKSYVSEILTRYRKVKSEK